MKEIYENLFISTYIFARIPAYKDIDYQQYTLKKHLYFYSKFLFPFIPPLHLQYPKQKDITLNSTYYEKNIFSYDITSTPRFATHSVGSHYQKSSAGFLVGGHEES